MKNIQITKRQEDIVRDFNNGTQTEVINRVIYRVMRDYQEIGAVDIYPSSVNINIYNTDGNTIEENAAMVEKMFNALNTEE